MKICNLFYSLLKIFSFSMKCEYWIPNLNYVILSLLINYFIIIFLMCRGENLNYHKYESWWKIFSKIYFGVIPIIFLTKVIDRHFKLYNLNSRSNYINLTFHEFKMYEILKLRNHILDGDTLCDLDYNMNKSTCFSTRELCFLSLCIEMAK